MSDWRDAKPSKYFSKSDLLKDAHGNPGITSVTLGAFYTDEIEKKKKMMIDLPNIGKPWIVGPVVCQQIERALGTSDPAQWAGKTVEVWHDPNVSFGNDIVGGLRVWQAPPSAAAPPAPPAQAPPPPPETPPGPAPGDDIPF